MTVVVALGGNALVRRGDPPDAACQVARLRQVAPALASLGAEHRLVVVHGNGPQVGMLALESAADPALAAPYPLGDLVAETQGLIGHWLQQALGNAGLGPRVAVVLTRTVVEAADPAFDHPTKFVGPSYPTARAQELAVRHGWAVAPDGDAWRRVVPSPLPVRIVELEVARTLLGAGLCVVLAGGGGVPVVETPEGLQGVEAVVDKDHVAALVARHLGADHLVLLTDVEAVMADFATPGQRPIGRVAPEGLRALDLPAGSMAPKVAAACTFVETTGGRAAIGALDDAAAVVAGTAGTQIETRP